MLVLGVLIIEKMSSRFNDLVQLNSKLKLARDISIVP